MDEVQARTRFQLQEEEKIKYADYLIENTSLEEASNNLVRLYHLFVKNCIKINYFEHESWVFSIIDFLDDTLPDRNYSYTTVMDQ